MRGSEKINVNSLLSELYNIFERRGVLMDDRQKITRFEKAKSPGLSRIILVYGFLMYAIPLTILFKIFTYICDYGLTAAPLSQFLKQSFILPTIGVIIAQGVVFGWIMWNIREHNYQKASRHKN